MPGLYIRKNAGNNGGYPWARTERGMGNPVAGSSGCLRHRLLTEEELRSRSKGIRRKITLVERQHPDELDVGEKVELEHTDDPEIARMIAADHIFEDPDYYKKLIEAGLADEPAVIETAKRLGLKKSLFVIPVTSLMEKALDTSKLVKKRITYNRGGKTVTANKWVRPGDGGSAGKPPVAQPPGGGGSGGAGGDDQTGVSGGPPRREIKIGDTIEYSANGRDFTGTVSKVGFYDGVIVKDERGKEYPVEWDHIRGPKDSGPTGKDSGSNRLFSESDEIRKLYKKSIKHEGWRNGETGMQPFSDFDGLHAMCEAARGDFLKKSQAIVKKFAGLKPRLITRPTLKDDGRIKEKIREDDNGSGCLYDKETDTYITREIRDVDGHTFSVNTVAEVQRLLEHFDHDPDIVRVKNNYAKPTPVGYSDINMNIKLPNGTIAEIQLNTHANIVAKEKYGHALYEVWRSTYKNPEFKELADIMGDAQKKLYGLSNMYSREGTFPDIGDKNPFFEVEHKPYADAIRGDVIKAKELFRKAKFAGILPPKAVKHFEELMGKVAG